MTKPESIRAEEMANAIPQVLDALVGSTGCNADSTLDDESLANIPKLQAVAEWLFHRMCAAERSIDSPYYSAKQVARSVIGACDALDDFYLDYMSTNVYCPHCESDFYVRMVGKDEPVRCAVCGRELAAPDGCGYTLVDADGEVRP